MKLLFSLLSIILFFFSCQGIIEPSFDSLKKIVFVSHIDGNRELYLTDYCSNNLLRLTYNGGQDGEPRFSPHGNIIAFNSFRNNKYDIFIMDINGHKLRNLTLSDENHESLFMARPVFSPNGKYIVYSATLLSDNSTQIFRINILTQEKIRLTNPPGNNDCPSFSPTGDEILFTSTRDGNSEIYIMTKAGQNQQNLTNHDSSDVCASFSPDGSKILFESHRSGNGDIYTMSVNGSNLIRSTNHPSWDRNPLYMPDNSYICFVSWRDHGANQDLYITDTYGGNPIALTNDPDAAIYLYDISSDGKAIAYISRGITTSLNIIELKNSRAQMICENAVSVRPDIYP